MGTISRLTASLGTAAIASVLFAPASLAASPTPSPALDTVLVAPTGSYTEEPSGKNDGPMSAADYAGSDSQTLAELRRDGYVQGYVRSWLDQAQKHFVVEEVIAFGGHRDAARWLTSVKDASSGQYLVHAISAAGVDSYFGGHYADPSQPLFSDLGIFLKGNDFFFVGASSKTDDLDDVAVTQAKRQYDAAPTYSISPSQWPENAAHLFGPVNLGAAAVPLAIGGGAILLVLVLAVVTVVVLLSRQRHPAVVAVATVAGGPQMSADGRYWWDGQAWRDTAKEIPPDAMRSADGFYWWDTRTWRPVPPPVS